MKSTSQPAGRFHLSSPDSFHSPNQRQLLVLVVSAALWLACHGSLVRVCQSTAISATHTSTTTSRGQLAERSQRLPPPPPPPPQAPDGEPPGGVQSAARHRKLSARSLDNVQQQQQQQVANSHEPQLAPATTLAAATAAQAQQVAAAAATNSTCHNTPTQADPALELEPLNLHPDQIQFGFTQSRASEFVKPNFYTLRLKVDPNKPKFSGQLMISIDLSQINEQPALPQAQAQSSSTSTTSTTTAPLANSTRYLTLHAGSNLSIKRAFYVFTTRSNIQIPATKIGRDLERELLTLDFHPNLIPIPSQGLLLLVYSGLVNQTDSHGLFVHKRPHVPISLPEPLASSKGPSEASLTGLATHMEPSFARRVFPGWDEPHLKARFSLIVVLPFRGYETLSNMPVKRKSISLSCSGESLQEIEFLTTPTMSTYLLTLVVGHLEHIESITPNNCRIRAYFYANTSQPLPVTIYTNATRQMAATSTSNTPTLSHQTSSPSSAQQPTSTNTNANTSNNNNNNNNNLNQRRQQAQMALDLAVKSFDYLESQLGVKYPLAKFDMIALRDFDSGGMENWGAALFHENYLLYDNSSSNVNIRVNGGANRPKRLVVPLVVAHEIAHQWFGNLLTSRTWNYLWLNEGFAQLLMYEVAQALHPQEPYWDIFLEDNRRFAMLEDELITSSRALELQETLALSQEDQLSLFDQLTYNKGAMLLRMAQFAFGPREFTAGLRHYLLKHAYDSVVSHDLWSALEESSSGRRLQDKQLEQLMSGWLSQEGYPLVSVRMHASPNEPNHYKLELRQERFTLLPTEASSWTPAEPGGNQARNDSGGGGGSLNWDNSIWSVPVTMVSELWPQPEDNQLGLWSHNNEKPARHPTSLLLSDKFQTISLPKAWVGKWLKFNYKAIGYFRVNYELDKVSSSSSSSSSPEGGQQIDLLELMKVAIRDGSLNSMDRFNVIEDLFSMVLAGRKPLVLYLRFLQDAYSQENDQLVLRFIFESLERIKLAIVSNAKATSQTSAAAAATTTTTTTTTTTATTKPTTMTTTNQMKLNQFEANFDRYVRKFVRKLIAAFKRRQRRQLNNAMSHHLGPASSSSSSGVADVSSDQQAAQFASFISLNWPQRQQQQHQQRQKGGNNNGANSKLVELLELLDSTLLTYSRDINTADNDNSNSNNNETPPMGPDGTDDADDRQQPLAALQLFARHFRQQSPIVASNPLQTQPRTLLDSMGRELRASIYSAALNHKQPVGSLSGDEQGETPPLPPTPLNEPQLRAYVTSSTGQFDLMRQQMRAAAAAAASLFNASSLSPAKPTATFTLEDQVFGRLLQAYEQAPLGSATERAALAQSLGSTRNLTKQIYLLNLTLAQTFFRPHDSMLLLDAVAQTQVGRQLIWLQLSDQSNLFKQRQLLSVALRSVSRGLIEMDQQQEGGASSSSHLSHQAVERQLRRLYAIYGAGEHGNLIGQCIEWVRINTLWFRRDHQQLAEYLANLFVVSDTAEQK